MNDAVAAAHRKGTLDAASLMVSGPSARAAVASAKRMPDLRVGLHLVLVDGKPTLRPDEIPDLVGPDGRLRQDMARLGFDLACKRAVRQQMRNEIAAQFAAFEKTGLVLDHVNAHKHFHLHPVVAETILAIGPAYGMKALRVPFEPGAAIAKAEKRLQWKSRDRRRHAGVFAMPAMTAVMAPWAAWLKMRAKGKGLLVADHVFGLRWSGHMDKARLAALLQDLPDGLVEIYMHPASGDDFDGHATGYDYRGELAALCDPAVIHLLTRSGRKRGGYANMAVA